MPRQEVASKCASAGFKRVDTDKNSITFVNGDNVYWTEFKDERLAFASREWYSSKGNLDVFQSALAALGAVSDSEGSLTCTITHAPLSSPDNQFNRIFIVCGKRSFLLMEGTMEGKKVVGVSERIGEASAE